MSLTNVSMNVHGAKPKCFLPITPQSRDRFKETYCTHSTRLWDTTANAGPLQRIQPRAGVDRGSTRAGILNTGRLASEEIGIAIEEYVLAQNAHPANVVEVATGDSDRARLAEVEAASPAAAASNQCEIFRSMRNLTFDELNISFVGDKLESGLGSNNMLENFRPESVPAHSIR